MYLHYESISDFDNFDLADPMVIATLLPWQCGKDFLWKVTISLRILRRIMGFDSVIVALFKYQSNIENAHTF